MLGNVWEWCDKIERSIPQPRSRDQFFTSFDDIKFTSFDDIEYTYPLLGGSWSDDANSIVYPTKCLGRADFRCNTFGLRLAFSLNK